MKMRTWPLLHTIEEKIFVEDVRERTQAETLRTVQTEQNHEMGCERGRERVGNKRIKRTRSQNGWAREEKGEAGLGKCSSEAGEA